MKNLAFLAITSLGIITFLTSCDEQKEEAAPVFGNESGDLFDTLTLTTEHPIALITRTESEINKSNHDTLLYFEKQFLMVKVAGGYDEYITYSGNAIDTALLATALPEGYCMTILVTKGRREADNSAIPISFTIQKIVNHMGGQ